ncbi:MAG: glycosyltransferase family 4 protein, partial [Candidatus Omnitrophica bacterium]|nr:glycosyltransferase family 4 protein [Candidatus Omnitrophota bacterium]
LMYREADIFILPSINEGMPLSLVEAMASGLAVIATDLPSLDRLVEDGTNGYRVATRDSRSIAAAIVRYLEGGPGLSTKHGEASRTRALLFRWSETARQYSGLYARICHA